MRFHLFPFRTEKLSSLTPMVLRFSRGRVGSRLFKVRSYDLTFFLCPARSGYLLDGRRSISFAKGTVPAISFGDRIRRPKQGRQQLTGSDERRRPVQLEEGVSGESLCASIAGM